MKLVIWHQDYMKFVYLLKIKAALAVNGTFFSCHKLTIIKSKQNNRVFRSAFRLSFRKTPLWASFTWEHKNRVPSHSRCGTIKIPPWSKTDLNIVSIEKLNNRPCRSLVLSVGMINSDFSIEFWYWNPFRHDFDRQECFMVTFNNIWQCEFIIY